MSRKIIFEGKTYTPYKFYMKHGDAVYWYCQNNDSPFNIEIIDINSSEETKNE